MESLKHLDGYEDALKWTKKDKSVARNYSDPRVAAPITSLKQVEEHFLSEKKIDLKTLCLYESLLGIPRQDILNFLESCQNQTTEELFYEIPLDLISSMNGRPCRTRDFEMSSAQEPESKFAKIPAVLLTTKTDTFYYVRGVQVGKFEGTTGLCCPLPTSGTLEQFAIIANPDGKCVLVSTTRKSILLINEFQLDVPDDEKLDWIDAIKKDDSVLLFWGGSDSLRGQISWSFSTGINSKSLILESNLLFHEITDADVFYQSSLKDSLEEQDYCVHGNILTLWKQHKDHEENGKRSWKKIQSLHVGHFMYDYKCEAEDVWGTPQQFVTIENGYAKTFVKNSVCLEEVASFKVPQDSKRICVLYSHSR